jgi:hypothetical protein
VAIRVERSSEEGPEPRGGNGPSLFTELPRGCVLGNSKTIEGQGVGAPALPYSPTFRERLFPETSDSPAPLGECLGDGTGAIGKIEGLDMISKPSIKRFVSQPSLWRIPDISSRLYARSVVVRTFPKEPVSSRKAVRDSSSCASRTTTRS